MAHLTSSAPVYFGAGTMDHYGELPMANQDDKEIIDEIHRVAYGIVGKIIVGIGIVGNILNLIVLTRPKLKGVMYVYLLGLAVSNLCVLISAIPALMAIERSGGVRKHSFAVAFFEAHLTMPLLNSFMAASVYIIICMTVNRYISIYMPTHFQRIHTFRNAYLAIAISFVGGLLLHIPLCFDRTVVPAHHSSGPNMTLYYKAEDNKELSERSLYKVYIGVSETLLRLGPIVTLTILNIMIIVRFNRIARKREVLRGTIHRGSNGTAIPAAVPTTNNHHQTEDFYQETQVPVLITHPTNESQAENKVIDGLPTHMNHNRSRSMSIGSRNVIIMRGTPNRPSVRRRGLQNPEERMLVVVLIAIVVLFVVCTTPAAILSILYLNKSLQEDIGFSQFRACANNLELLGFALNFFVYCLCSADIRQAFMDVLFENWLVQSSRQCAANCSKAALPQISVELFDISAQNEVPNTVAPTPLPMRTTIATVGTVSTAIHQPISEHEHTSAISSDCHNHHFRIKQQGITQL